MFSIKTKYKQSLLKIQNNEKIFHQISCIQNIITFKLFVCVIWNKKKRTSTSYITRLSTQTLKK